MFRADILYTRTTRTYDAEHFRHLTVGRSRITSREGSRVPLLGRETELARLCDGLADLRRGRGRTCVLRGEPGIGKTRLAQELAARAVADGVRVIWGRCDEHARGQALWPWIQGLRSCVRDMEPDDLRKAVGLSGSSIAAIVPELPESVRGLSTVAEADAETARFRLFDAVARFLDRASRERPILVVLDDLHWADQASLLLLAFSHRNSGSSRY
jgi:predicted ATPase